MKLNDFFTQPKKSIRSRSPKVISVINEAREQEFKATIDTLQKEVDRLKTIEDSHSEAQAALQISERSLQTVRENLNVESSQRKIAEASVTKLERVGNEKIMLEQELKDAKVHHDEALSKLEQSEKKVTEVITHNAGLQVKLDATATQRDDLESRIGQALGQANDSLAGFQMLQKKLEEKVEMFSAIEVKYKEEAANARELAIELAYWRSVADGLEEEKEQVDRTSNALQFLVDNLTSDNQLKSGEAKVSNAEAVKLKGIVEKMTETIDYLTTSNTDLNEKIAALQVKLARPKYMSMGAVEKSEAFKLPKGGYRKSFLGTSKPTLLTFKKEV